MLIKNKNNAYAGILSAFAIETLLAMYVMFSTSQGGVEAGWFQLPAAVIAFLKIVIRGLYLWGFYNEVKGKGYSVWYALLGFLGIYGLVVVIALPDRLKDKDKYSRLKSKSRKK